MNKLIQSYVDRFLNRTDLHIQQGVNEDGHCFYWTVKPDHQLFIENHEERIIQHLKGRITLSLPAVNTMGYCKWACWDSDHERGHLNAIEDFLVALKLSPHRESKRPGREGHMWLFFNRPIHSSILIRFNEELFAQAELEKNAVEFFPKFTDKHSQIRAPLGIHRKKEARNVRGFFEQCESDLNAQLRWLADLPGDDPERIERVALKLFDIDREEQDRLNRKRPVSGFTHQNNGADFHILQYVQPTGIRGNNHIAPCPLCRNEGHDRRGDNLRIDRQNPSQWCWCRSRRTAGSGWSTRPASSGTRRTP